MKYRQHKRVYVYKPNLFLQPHGLSLLRTKLLNDISLFIDVFYFFFE